MKTWSFRDFVKVLKRHGFKLDRKSGATRIYKGVVDKELKLVTIHYHKGGEDIMLGTLNAMIKQSGLPKQLFR